MGIVTSATAQGPRDSQEDYLVHLPFTLKDGSAGHLLAIMDGHRGNAAAKRCAALIPELFSLRSANEAEKTLKNLIAELHERTKTHVAGTTISLACICERDRAATTAVLGDSPIFVLDRDLCVHTSVEHRVRTHHGERKRVIESGALYQGDYFYDPHTGQGLQITRTLGDADLNAYLSRKPKLATYALDADSIVMVCSDGMSNPGHIESELYPVLALGRANNINTAAGVLKWRAGLPGGLTDNTTVLLWVSE